MSRKTKLALPIAVALGIAALPVAASASRDGGNYDRDSDWGYWSANNNAQVSTQFETGKRLDSLQLQPVPRTQEARGRSLIRRTFLALLGTGGPVLRRLGRRRHTRGGPRLPRAACYGGLAAPYPQRRTRTPFTMKMRRSGSKITSRVNLGGPQDCLEIGFGPAIHSWRGKRGWREPKAFGADKVGYRPESTYFRCVGVMSAGLGSAAPELSVCFNSSVRPRLFALLL
jgi:hypothetical protein